MRGKAQAQPDFLTVVNLNQCVPADHPLRAIKRRVETVLQRLSPLFEEVYSATGTPSVPPEQLLKARVLIALYSVRSERLFCEQLGYNLLWLWFLDREFSEGSFDHSTFSKNYERVQPQTGAQPGQLGQIDGGGGTESPSKSLKGRGQPCFCPLNALSSPAAP